MSSHRSQRRWWTRPGSPVCAWCSRNMPSSRSSLPRPTRPSTPVSRRLPRSGVSRRTATGCCALRRGRGGARRSGRRLGILGRHWLLRVLERRPGGRSGARGRGGAPGRVVAAARPLSERVVHVVRRPPRSASCSPWSAAASAARRTPWLRCTPAPWSGSGRARGQAVGRPGPPAQARRPRPVARARPGRRAGPTRRGHGRRKRPQVVATGALEQAGESARALADKPLPRRVLAPARGTVALSFAIREELEDPLTPVLALGATASAIVGSVVDAALVATVLAGNAFVSGVQRVSAPSGRCTSSCSSRPSRPAGWRRGLPTSARS